MIYKKLRYLKDNIFKHSLTQMCNHSIVLMKYTFTVPFIQETIMHM